MCMSLVQANCRVQFTAEDLDFIVATLGSKTGGKECLVQLLTDEASRDTILDDPKLYHALLEHRGCVRVSTHFYFYVLVRQVLRRSDINDRSVADYVAEMLVKFAHPQQAQCVVTGRAEPCEYFFEMLAALQNADDRGNFLIRAHMGNYSLFLAGVFPDRIRFRAESRGFPSLRYYEQLGQTSYRVASDHPLARRYKMAEIFATLGERFQAARLALNDLANRIISLGEVECGIDKLLRPDGGGGLTPMS